MSEHDIRIRVNGTERTIASGTTVAGLIESLDLRPEMVVVERNREILDRARYATVRLDEGDSLELVHFVGGG